MLMWLGALVGFLISAGIVAVLTEAAPEPIPSNVYGIVVLVVTAAYVLIRRNRRRNAADRD